MPYRLAVAAWIALATLVPPAAAQDAPEAAACRDLTNSLDAEPATATAFCDAIAVLAERAEAAEARAAAIESRLGEVAPWVAPPGAILLVDDVRGCPDGWTDVAIDEPEVFAGRFPVAAGVGIPEEVPRHRDLGGALQLQLGPGDVPPHTHDLPLRFTRVPGVDTGRTGSGLVTGSARDQLAVPARTGRERTGTAGTGTGAPLENRPPFVGLFWCRRD
jgi:hypothetical protein